MFSPKKGWKTEIEEISLGFVIALLLVVGVNAKVASATGPGQVFWGKINSIFMVCVETTAGNTCDLAGYNRFPPPSVVISVQGSQMFVQPANPSMSLGISKYPTAGGWILGFGVPGKGAFIPTRFWMYP